MAGPGQIIQCSWTMPRYNDNQVMVNYNRLLIIVVAWLVVMMNPYCSLVIRISWLEIDHHWISWWVIVFHLDILDYHLRNTPAVDHTSWATLRFFILVRLLVYQRKGTRACDRVDGLTSRIGLFFINSSKLRATSLTHHSVEGISHVNMNQLSQE